jgi:hypothetical protein
MLAENAPLVRSGLILRECHFSFVQQKMLGDARLEIAVPVRANPNNSRLCFSVIATFVLLVKKVYSVGGERL